MHDMYRDEPTVCEVRGKRTAQQVPLTVGSNNASAMSGCIRETKMIIPGSVSALHHDQAPDLFGGDM